MRHLAVLSSQIQPGSPRMQLLPAGDFVTVDGRKLRLNADDAAHVLADHALRKNPLVLDYEHATLYAGKNGQPAPAAGWFRALDFVPSGPDAGLYATDVELTARAREMVTAEPPEYRYVSAVVELAMIDAQVGAVRKLHHAGLTNTPAVDGMRAVAALSAQLEIPTVPLIEKLIAALALDASATEDAVVEAVVALKQSGDAATTELAALKAGTTTPDLSKFVPIAAFCDLQKDFAALKARTDGAETDALIAAAIDAGKPIAAATETWLRDLAKSQGVAALKTHLAAMPVIAALKGSQTGGRKPSGTGATEPDADQIALCKQMGITVESFKKAAAAA